jgi:hypothetical protein
MSLSPLTNRPRNNCEKQLHRLDLSHQKQLFWTESFTVSPMALAAKSAVMMADGTLPLAMSFPRERLEAGALARLTIGELIRRDH